MADFKIAKALVAQREGGYSWASGDTGGETWAGIARNWHPFWGGWSIVDNAKRTLGFMRPLDQYAQWQAITDLLKGNEGLATLTEAFYRTTFWAKIAGDSIEDQDMANALYDSIVNNGPEAVYWIQRILYALCIDQTGAKRWPEIGIDGYMTDGGETVEALNAAMRHPWGKNAVPLFFSAFRRVNIVTQGVNSPTYRKFSTGLSQRS